MGFLDSLAKSVLKQATKAAVSTAVNNAMNGNNNNQQNTPAAQAAPIQQASSAQQAASAQQIAPPKADIQRKVTYYTYDESEKDVRIECSFMLSGDFVETTTGAGEIDAVYMYDPSCNEDYTEYSSSDSRPYFMVTGDIDEVFVPVRDFEQGKGIKDAISFQPIQGGRALFKAQINYYKKWIMTYYGFRHKYGVQHPWGFCMVYETGLKGTALENRLISELDKAMASLEERLLTE